MNRYLRERLMGNRAEYRDSRQGVKGTGRYGIGGRDRGDYMDDYDERSYGRGDYAYRGRRDSRGRNDYESGRQFVDSRRSSRDMNYDDYENYHDFEYNSEMNLELNKRDIRKWENELKNADGSHGAKFSKEQIIPIARQNGIEFDENKFTEDEFVITVNMLYSDFCEAVQKSSLPSYDRPELYVHMAKAWLCDDDFSGKPYEKLALYYHTIVDYDD